MGFFGSYVYDGAGWTSVDPTATVDVPEPGLWVMVHDSDVTRLTYRPSGRGSGEAFVGYTPRSYFEDETASAPTDVAREAAGLHDWATAVVGSSPGEEAIAAFLAADEEEIDDFDESDDAEIFVEVKTARLLTALGLPLPDALRP
jgi:hypothetical protein